VIVVPAFASSEEGHPPDIDAIVFADKIAVAELGDVADEVEEKWQLLRGQARKYADQSDLVAKYKEEQKARRKTDDAVESMHTTPVATLLEKHVKRIFDQVFGLSLRIEIIGV